MGFVKQDMSLSRYKQQMEEENSRASCCWSLHHDAGTVHGGLGDLSLPVISQTGSFTPLLSILPSDRKSEEWEGRRLE